MLCSWLITWLLWAQITWNAACWVLSSAWLIYIQLMTTVSFPLTRHQKNPRWRCGRDEWQIHHQSYSELYTTIGCPNDRTLKTSCTPCTTALGCTNPTRAAGGTQPGPERVWAQHAAASPASLRPSPATMTCSWQPGSQDALLGVGEGRPHVPLAAHVWPEPPSYSMSTLILLLCRSRKIDDKYISSRERHYEQSKRNTKIIFWGIFTTVISNNTSLQGNTAVWAGFQSKSSFFFLETSYN